MTATQIFNSLDIEFENVRFLRATSLSTTNIIRLTVVVHIGTGNFEVSENTTAVISGTVRAMKNGEPIKDISQWITSDQTTTLDAKDFYKELRLRGYHYANIFKSVVEVASDGSTGKVKWQNNWPAFMDNMLQVNILQLDSRSLYIPTSIRKIRINTEKHLEMVEALDPENPVMEVRMSKDFNIVTCGGIEIEGLVCNSVGRRKPPGTEVLESYDFIPFNCDNVEYSVNDAIAIFMQIGLENLMQYKLKIIEIDDNEPEPKTLIQVFDDVIVNIPLVTAELTLLRKEKIEIDHVKVEDVELKDQTNCQIIIASKCLKEKTELIAQAQASLTDKGFLVLREDRDIFWNEIQCPEGFNLISVIKVPDEALILLQRIQPATSKTAITVDSKDITFEWLDPLKEAVKNGVTIAVEHSNDSGLIGLINCIRREPGGNLVRCVLIDDKSAPQFDLDNSLYAEQLKLDLGVNVYKNGKWGAYRHLLLRADNDEMGRTTHYFANVRRIGDLSSFEWMTGWINPAKCDKLVMIQFSAINFRDVMLATGRLPIEVHTTNRLYQQCVLGLEYSGVRSNGERIMGMVATGGLATVTGIKK